MTGIISRLSAFSYRNLPLLVFVILTFGGCAFIAFSKVSGMNPITSMLVPIALMFAYLALAWMFSAIRLHDEQIGDNLYYMGFLFTLASLGASLYLFTGESSTDEVVRNFGIAISSTITGIALRIFYNQSRRDVLDIERATRHDLAAVARRVRAELESSTREFASLRRANNQLINEGFESVVKQVNKTGEKLAGALSNLTDVTLKPLEEVSSKFNSAIEDSLKGVSTKLSDVTSKIDESASVVMKTNQSMLSAAEGLTRQVDNIAKKLEAVAIPDGVLKNEMEPILKDFGKLLKDQVAHNDTVAKEQANRIDKLLSSVTAISEAVAKNLQQSERLIQTNEGLSEQVKAQQAQVELLIREQANAKAPVDAIVVHQSEPAPGAQADPVPVDPVMTTDETTPPEANSTDGKSWWPFR